MRDPSRAVERAIRWTPARDRPRYEPEWRADLGAARDAGLDEVAVARGASRMAVRLRERQVERALLGRSGTARAVAAWGLLVGAAGAAGILGGPALVIVVLLLLGVASLLARAGTPSHWSHLLMLASMAVVVLAGSYVWWVAGVRIDAADTGAPEPAAARWGGAGLLAVLAGGVGFLASAVVAAAREARRGQR